MQLCPSCWRIERLAVTECPLLAQSRHELVRCTCLLSWSLLGVKRTCHVAPHKSASDPKRTLKSWAPLRRSLAFLPAYTFQFLEDHSISRYAVHGQILVVVRAREEDCFVIYSSPVFRPAERPSWTVSSPNTRFEVYSKCLWFASIVGKLAFQIEHLSRRRHRRNCNSKCAGKEKPVRASHSLSPKCRRNPIAARRS